MFSFLSYLFDLLLYKPLFNGLIFFYNTVAFRDLGVAIVLFTILIRLLLAPLFSLFSSHQKKMNQLQGEVARLQAAHKGDREAQTQAVLALYKEHGVNPFFPFLFLLVQLPVFIALFKVFQTTGDFSHNLYPFITAPDSLNYSFLGLIKLAEPSMVVTVLAALAQGLQSAVGLVAARLHGALAAALGTQRAMTAIIPITTFALFWWFKLPAAVGLYLLTITLVQAGQQYLMEIYYHAAAQRKHGAPPRPHGVSRGSDRT
ncbi:MAG: membrane protein insertase YidC [Candidatus Colwellbacteria bacterium]|nr:membrane protein insertase YidC [Candidatus Colwellbacteria bacterium]